MRRIGRLTTWTAPVLERAAVLIRGGKVAWIGPDAALPRGLGEPPEFDAAGAAVLPGFVDCHTHAVWAGDRREELTARAGGARYATGGIHRTVAATATASDATLRRLTAARLTAMRRSGTTTVEVKSGYALSTPGELRLLTVAAAAAREAGVEAELTYLAAHVAPQGRDLPSYVEEVVAGIPAAVAAGARWCDVFCDEGAFDVAAARRILLAARDAGMGLRIHAEQLAATGAARLAAELGCASADHLEHIDEGGARALAGAGVVAVLTPVAALQTRHHGAGHLARLRRAGATLAIATDCNPGTAWCESMPLAIQLATWLWGMPVPDALRAATLGGAAALRRGDVGRLVVGGRGDLVVLNADHEADLAVHLGADPVRASVSGGSLLR